MAPYEVAIERVKRLFRERSDPGWWADNIQEASRDIPLDSKYDWSRFYSYITNPSGFNERTVFPTLDDLTEKLTEIPKYEDCLEVVEYPNGPGETVIHVKRKTEESDDEKKEPDE